MNIVLIDDHRLFAEGLQMLLADFESATKVVIYTSCESALHDPAADSVELVLLDYCLSGLSKLRALEQVRKHYSNARIVVVSAVEDPAVILAIIEAGAAGYIPKTSTYAVLSAALQLVAAGGTYLPAEALEDVPVTGRPMDSIVSGNTGLDCLSNRQQEVLLQVVQGLPNKVIAQNLEISEHTVKAHVSAAFKLLGVKNRTEAVYAAAKLQRATLTGQTVNAAE